jgi:hypothetical protein
MNTKKEGFAPAFCVLLGCAIIISGILITNDTYYTQKLSQKHILVVKTIEQKSISLQSYTEALHLYALATGISSIGLGLIFAYRPSLIQVKNYVPFEYPYPIWNSKDQPIPKFGKNLILAKELLTDKERMLLCRFRYILVSIDGKPYLVSPHEYIPEDSIIMRTKSGKALCGIYKF